MCVSECIQVSPTSFFQTCTPQSEKLYAVVESMVDSVGGGAMQEGQGGAGGGAGAASGRAGGTVVYDLFCGTGSIGLSLYLSILLLFRRNSVLVHQHLLTGTEVLAYWYKSTCLLVQKVLAYWYKSALWRGGG
jgi:hypothetical protein